MKVKGYKYNTKKEAIDARENCDTYYGIPVNPNDITQNWCDYIEANLNEPIFWYIIYDESLIPILGIPTEFEVITSTIP